MMCGCFYLAAGIQYLGFARNWLSCSDWNFTLQNIQPLSINFMAYIFYLSVPVDSMPIRKPQLRGEYTV